jgi:hypothetical protein
MKQGANDNVFRRFSLTGSYCSRIIAPYNIAPRSRKRQRLLAFFAFWPIRQARCVVRGSPQAQLLELLRRNTGPLESTLAKVCENKRL